AQLDERIKELIGQNEELGAESVRACLRGEGVRVQLERVRQSLIRVNPQGVVVIHGAVDGYSRPLVFLKASDNNRSATVMESFEAAITSYGVPSRVRCDRGGNSGVVREEVPSGEGAQPEDRAAVVGHLRCHVWHANVYHDLFTFLETEQIIDIKNEVHLWALHFVFLQRVNRDLAVFASQWNHHGLRTEQRQSPLQLFVSGSLAMQRANLTAVRDLFAPALTTITSQATTSAPPTTTPTSAPPNHHLSSSNHHPNLSSSNHHLSSSNHHPNLSSSNHHHLSSSNHWLPQVLLVEGSSMQPGSDIYRGLWQSTHCPKCSTLTL
ncbi:unnamed protein product, partial [Coregonus sp. 'balchen']